MKLTLEAEIPESDLEIFLHWVRAFDKSHHGCHFQIAAVGGGMSVEDLKEMFERVGLPVVYAGKRQ